jgi:hypothetical protein
MKALTKSTGHKVEFDLDDRAFSLLQIMAAHDGYADASECVKALVASEVRAFLHAIDEEETKGIFGVVHPQ